MLASADLLTAFVLFAFVSSITPGPNNTMLLASGVNFGVRRSIPHAMGISVGFMVMVLAVGLGLGEVFKAWPVLYSVLRYTGAAYLLYLAWKIATSGPLGADSPSARKPWGSGGGGIPVGQPQGLGDGGRGNHYLHACPGLRDECDRHRRTVRFGQPAQRRRLGDVRQRPAQPAAEPRWLMLFNVLMALLLVISLYPLLFVESAFS